MYWNSYTVYTFQGTRFEKSIGEFAGKGLHRVGRNSILMDHGWEGQIELVVVA